MFIDAFLQIADPGKCQASAQQNLSELPLPGIQRICSMLPSTDMTKATCIRKSESIDTKDKYLLSKVVRSSETRYEIDAGQALDLPR